jgi:hypothetical protein
MLKLSKLTMIVIALVAAFIGLQVAGSYSGRSSGASDNKQQTASTAQSPAQPQQPESNEPDLPVKEEIHQTYQLTPGARVEIRRINGSLEIETSETQTAEIHLFRSALNHSTLARQRTVIQHKPTNLYLGSRDDNDSLWDLMQGHDELRLRATLKLPRKIRLSIRNVSGNITVGRVDDSVEVGGVSGKVTLAQVVGALDIFRIDGAVQAAIRDPDKRGIEVSRISGPVELRFLTPVNADLEVQGLQGGFNDKGMNVVMNEKRGDSNFTARTGTGGIPISFSRIVGSVTLIRADEASKPVAVNATRNSARR